MAYKEIVTKAIIGKGKKYFKDSYNLDTNELPTTVLGCWVINHNFKGYKSGSKIGVEGSYDVNIWYSYDNDSKTTVVSKKVTYNNLFSFDIEKELGIEIIGETKVKINIEDDEEPWDLIEDDVDDTVMDEIDEKVNDDFIENE